MLKVISSKTCPFVQRVTALLEAKKIPYDIEYIELRNKPDWFLEISPHAQVPVLITETGQALFESEAIIEYLEEAYPALDGHATPEQRAVNRAWGYLGAKHYMTQCGTLSSTDEVTFNERFVPLSKAFTAIEAYLGKSTYFNSDTVGLVDVAWLPILHRIALIEKHTGYDFLASFPKMQIWQHHLMGSALAEKSVAEDFEELFTAAYLSDETYLGSLETACSPMAGRPRAAVGCC